MKNSLQEGHPWVVTFTPDDTLEEKLKKAAHVKPSPAQLAWMEKEYIAFVHYGPNTFNGQQWGSGAEKIADYSPVSVDVAQWCRVCARAGMKMMIFTAKHHDGFCLWNTKTTDFSIQATTAKADIMAALETGCNNNNIELGVYLSPWDMHQRGKGLWGTKEYNDYFLRQLDELLSNYGAINEVWFDGACSDYEIWQAVPSYTPEKWYEHIESKHPYAVIRLYDPYNFADDEEWQQIKDGCAPLKWSGKAVRWVGNEGGGSRGDEWSVQPVFERQIAENATLNDLGEEKYYENAVGAIWYPLEVNTVVQNQWFWNEKTSVLRSLEDLVQVYYNSIGNNGVLLLNVSPNTQGVISNDQINRLEQLKQYVDNTFGQNLAAGAEVFATQEARGQEAAHVLDDDKTTYWTTGNSWDINSSSASITIVLKSKKTFDNVMVQEFIREGQRVAEWSLEIWTGNAWEEMVRHKTIGYKNIKRFAAVTTSKVRLNILRSWDSPMICGFGLYLSDKLPEDEARTQEAVSLEPIAMNPAKLKSGLKYNCYDRGLQSASLLDSIFAVKLLKSGIAGKVDTSCAISDIGYSLVYTGFLRVLEDGEHVFKLESADGSLMFLDEALLINNDEPHKAKAMLRTVNLKQGYYPIKILYTSFRNPGLLRLCWKKPSQDMQEIGEESYCF